MVPICSYTGLVTCCKCIKYLTRSDNMTSVGSINKTSFFTSDRKFIISNVFYVFFRVLRILCQVLNDI